jgi:hypothetical protein
VHFPIEQVEAMAGLEEGARLRSLLSWLAGFDATLASLLEEADGWGHGESDSHALKTLKDGAVLLRVARELEEGDGAGDAGEAKVGGLLRPVKRKAMPSS